MISRAWLSSFNDARPSDIAGHLLYLYDITVELGAKSVLELGVRGGISTRAFLTALESTDGHLYSVDRDIGDLSFRPGQIGGDMEEVALRRWTLIRGLSLEVEVPQLAWDIVFIDTDHGFKITLAELQRFAPHVRPGGAVLLHDWEATQPHMDVEGATRAFLADEPEGAWALEAREGSYGLGIIRRKEAPSEA